MIRTYGPVCVRIFWWGIAHLVLKPKGGLINLKYLTVLLNSKLFNYWFYHRGKWKGDQLQIDKQLLLNAPIKIGDAEEQTALIGEMDKIP